MMNYINQRVLIIGASSGIGEALAIEFAAQGAHLVLAARRLERLEVLANSLRKTDRQILCYACDVTQEGHVEHVVSAATTALGGIDVVVANAGFGVAGDVEKLSLADYRRQFETNVFGVLRTAKASLGELKKTKGRLGIVGSVNGYVALPGISAYAMSKFCVRALCDALYHEAKEWGVSVTHIAPGFIVSEIRKVDNQGGLHAQAKDPIPMWIQMPSAIAAKKIAKALWNRKRERVITSHGWWAVRLQRYLPGVVASLIQWFGIRARPEPTK